MEYLGQSSKEIYTSLISGHRLPILLFLAISVYFVWPAPMMLGRLSTSGGEEKLLSYLMNWGTHSLFNQPNSLFHPPFFHGQELPLAFSDYLIGAGLISSIIKLVTYEPFAVFQMAVFLAFFLNAFFTYLFCEQVLKQRLWSVLAGSIYAFSVARLDSMGHVQVVSSYFIPLGLYYVVRAYENSQIRWSIMAGILFFLQAITTVLLAYFYAFLLVLFSIARMMTDTHAIHRLWRLWIGILPGIALTLVAYLPYLQVSSLHDYTRTLDDAWGGSMFILEYFYPTGNSRLRPIADHLFNKHPWPGYLGAAVSLGYVVSLVVWIKQRKRLGSHWFGLFSLGVSVLGFILSLGPYLQFDKHAHLPWFKIPLPYLLLFDYLPGFKSMRTPQRWNHFMLFGMSLFIAYVFSRVFRKTAIKHFLGVVFVIILIVWEAALPIFTVPVQGRENMPLSYEALLTQNPGVVLELPSQTWYMPLVTTEIDRLHWQSYLFDTQMVWFNGYSGFSPGNFMHTNERLNKFVEVDEFYLALKDIRADYIIFHTQEWEFLRTEKAYTTQDTLTIIDLIENHPLYVKLYTFSDGSIIFHRQGDWF